MPSNKITINGNIEHEVPDSFMPPLEAYLKMVEEKCTSNEDVVVADDTVSFSRKELRGIREKAFSVSSGVRSNTCWKRGLIALGDVTDRLDAMIARAEADEAVEEGS